MTENKTAMVVSAHSTDFVWRAGGAVVLCAARGWRIVVVCLSFGERGEPAKLWREPGMTLEKIRGSQKDDARRAAEILGAEVNLLNLGNDPMRLAGARNSGRSNMKYGEAYHRLFPQVTDVLQ